MKRLMVILISALFMVAGCAKEEASKEEAKGKKEEAKKDDKGKVVDDKEKQRGAEETGKAPGEEAGPAKEAKPAEQIKPADDAEPAEEAKPAEETQSADEAGQADEAGPAAEAKPAEETETAEEVEPADEAKPTEETEPAGESISDDEPETADEPAVDPHAASEDNLLVAAYEVPTLDVGLARKLSLALADRDGVVSTKADMDNGLFQVTYSSGCPHSMLAALQTVVPEATLQGVTSREGEAPAKSGCGGCPKKASCTGSE